MEEKPIVTAAAKSCAKMYCQTVHGKSENGALSGARSEGAGRKELRQLSQHGHV